MQKRRPQRRGREDALFGDVVFPLERKGVLLKLHQPRAHAAVSAAEERSSGAMRGPCACACAGKAGMAGVVRGMKQHAARKNLLLVAAAALQAVGRERDVRARHSHASLR